LRLSIVILILVLAVGSIVIFLGFLTNQEYVDVPEISSQYENLEKYKNELEKLNQYNQQILKELEEQFKNSDNVHLDQLNEEIKAEVRVVFFDFLLRNFFAIREPPKIAHAKPIKTSGASLTKCPIGSFLGSILSV